MELFKFILMILFILILGIFLIKRLKSAELSFGIATLVFVIIAYILQKLSIINILNLKI